jgi:hypothetical protein
MGCLFVLLALAIPRVLIVLLWLLSHWFSGMFRTALLPVMGFVFLPTTLLWYSAVQNWWGGVWTFWPAVGLVIAILIDMSPGGSRRLRRRRSY